MANERDREMAREWLGDPKLMGEVGDEFIVFVAKVRAEGRADGVKAERERVSSALKAATETAETLGAVVSQARVSGIEQGRAEALAKLREDLHDYPRSSDYVWDDFRGMVDDAERTLSVTPREVKT